MALHKSLVVLATFAALAARADPAGVEPQTGTTTARQDREELLVEGELENGGYGGPRIAYGRVASHDALYLGGEGGWIVNHQFILGGAVYGLITNQPAPGPWASSHDLTMIYGGGMLGYTLAPRRLVHLTFTTLIGAGGMGRKIRGTDSETDLGDSFFIVEPAVTVDLNVARHLKWGVTISYRIVRDVEVAGFSNTSLSGPFGSMIVKFGKF